MNFSANDYLGLASDPRVIEAARTAAERYGWGAGASALVTGWREPHEALAEELARFEGTEAVALFGSGYSANLGTIAALVERGDGVYLDRLSHACLVDGARLSGAQVRVFPHNDADRLRSILERERSRFRRVLIVTEGVFSMDGDLAPVGDLADVAERFDAMLMVDEAHGTGVFGPSGRGAAEALGATERVPVKVGTLSKAMGSMGGFVAGSRRLVDYLQNAARTLIFSTALPPSAAAAASEALRILQEEPWRRQRVLGLGERVREGLRGSGLTVLSSSGPIVPVLVGEPEAAVTWSRRLREAGFLVPAIRPPTVPRGTSRLRLSLSANHSDEQIDAVVRALCDGGPERHSLG